MLKTDNILDLARALEKHRFPDLGWDPTCFYWGPDTGGKFLYPDRSGRNLPKVADIAGWAISVEQGHSIDITNLLGGYLVWWKTKRRVQQFLGIDPLQYEDLVHFRNHPMMGGHLSPFSGERGDTEWTKDITMGEYANLLRRLAKTGKVEWRA